MGKSLVIVESPAKAKTINKYLGSDFIVKSSVGHVRDLPTAGSAPASDPKERAAQAAITRKMAPDEKVRYQAKKKREQLVRRMGVDPKNGWAARYEVLPGKEKVVDELKKLAKSADAIYLATDLDREGEAIAWHLKEIIGGDDSRYQRVVFNEITKRAIQESFSKPTQLDTNRVNAQQARRFLDRVVGFEVSPLLWTKIARGLSAGRVQSVAVRLIVEREREIRAFVPEEYWQLHADLQRGDDAPVRFEVVRAQGKAFEPKSQADAAVAVSALSSSSFAVSDLEARKTSSRPPAPFITSTLQQAASTRLGFSVKKTMTLAQRLYEAGHITYMRTDSTNLSSESVASCRDYISEHFSGAYLPESPNRYGAREGAQEAVHDYVFGDFNVAQQSKVWSVANGQYGEIWWFYCSSNSTEIDRYVAFDYKENHWLIGELSRTSGVQRGVFRYPFMAGHNADSDIYNHEVGFNFDSATTFAETGPISIGAGDQIAKVTKLIPDEITQGDVNVTFKTRFYPNATETTHGPYTPANPTSVRFSGRQLRMRVEGQSATQWKVGNMRIDAIAGGRR